MTTTNVIMTLHAIGEGVTFFISLQHHKMTNQIINQDLIIIHFLPFISKQRICR